MTMIEVKELPDDRATSKYSPVDEKVGAPTGSDPYWATVKAPTPVAEAVVPSLVAVAVPVELVDVPLAELVEPAGGGGGVGPAAETEIVFDVPVMLEVTVSVAEMVWLPTVASVAEKVCTPLVSVASAGRVALPSVLAKCTVPL